MNRNLPAFLAIAIAATPAFGAERRYSVTDFDRIQIEGPFEVTLDTGGAPSASASGGQDAIDRVIVEVEGRTLRVRPNRSAWGGYPGESAGPVRIALSTHDLRGAVLSGSGSLAIDHAEAMRFDLSLVGNGRIAVGDIEADKLVVSMLGAGRVTLAGKVKELDATVQGAAELDAPALIAMDARISADTAGTVTVGAIRTAKVTASGPGDITVTGSAACTVQALGAGRVRCGR